MAPVYTAQPSGPARLLCFFGRHAGRFEFVREGSCETRRTCTRPGCGVTETGAQHAFAGPGAVVRYWDDDSCEAKGVCVRCGQFGGYAGIIHDWGPYVREWHDGHAIAVRICGHCASYQELAIG